MGIFAGLFITGLVLYLAGSLMAIKERAQDRNWEINLERKYKDLPPIPPPLWTRLSIRGCLWTFILVSIAALAAGFALEGVWT